MVIVPILFIVVIYYFVFFRPKQIESATATATAKWDAQQSKYESIVRKLPPDLVNELFTLLKHACDQTNRVVPDTYPEELMKMTLAAGAVVKSGTYGAVTRDQHRLIKATLDEKLKWVTDTYIPAANQALMQLADTDGLGFGIITSSAADMLLYDVMDTHQRLKGNEKKIKEYEDAIDKQLVPIFEKIRQIVS